MILKQLNEMQMKMYPIDAEIYCHFTQKYYEYYKRQISGEDILIKYLSLVCQIKSTKFENTDMLILADLYVAKIYHQIGLCYQNKSKHEEAMRYFDYALHIRNIYCSPEEGFTKFQQYLNAYYAVMHGNPSLLYNILHEDNNNNDIKISYCTKLHGLIETERDYLCYASSSDSSEMNFERAIQWNNIGYVYQTIAQLSYQNDPYEVGIKIGKHMEYMQLALYYYISGIDKRLMNDDYIMKDFERCLRLFSQTLVRITQCLLYLLNINEYFVQKRNYEYLTLSFHCISFVKQVYMSIPLEEHRIVDLKNLEIDLEFYSRKYNYKSIDDEIGDMPSLSTLKNIVKQLKNTYDYIHGMILHFK